MILAELKIEEIICGWQDAYDQAINECPNGMMLLGVDNFGDGKYFYHPVECRRLLLHEFNKAKLDVEQVLNDRLKMSMDNFINKIVKLDAKLFSMINQWVSEDLDISCFNPKDFMNESEKDLMEGYINPYDNKYADMRIVK